MSDHLDLAGALWDYAELIEAAGTAAYDGDWEEYADALVAAKTVFEERVTPLHTAAAYWEKVDPAIWRKVED